jgi:O-antigen/teichoic acid export membrane protein
VGVTSEALYLVLPSVVMLTAALAQSRADIRNGLLVGLAVLALTQAMYFVSIIQWAYERFGLIARAKAVSVVVAAVFTLVTIWWIGIYAAILAPGAAALATIAVLKWGAPHLGLAFELNRTDLTRLFKVGLPLAIGTVCYWGFRAVDRTAVAVALPLTDLGYFTFVMQFINVAILFVADFGNVIQPKVWASLGTTADPRSIGPAVRRLSTVVMFATCAGANFAQAGFGVFVTWFLPNFRASVPIFDILVLLLACGTAGVIPTHLLNSARLNKQVTATVIYAAGVLLTGILVVLAIWWGWGLSGVALVSVIAQALVSACLLGAVHPSIFAPGGAVVRFYAALLGMLLVAVAVSLIFYTEPLALGGNRGQLPILALRVAFAVLVWGIGFAALGPGRKWLAARQ